MTPVDWDGDGFALHLPLGDQSLTLRFGRARGVSAIRGTVIQS